MPSGAGAKKAGKEESERLDWRVLIEEGAGRKMQAQTKKGEKMMTQRDTYRIVKQKGP